MLPSSFAAAVRPRFASCWRVRFDDMEPYFETDFVGGRPVVVLELSALLTTLPLRMAKRGPVPPVRSFLSLRLFCSACVGFLCREFLRFCWYIYSSLWLFFTSWLFELLFTSHDLQFTSLLRTYYYFTLLRASPHTFSASLVQSMTSPYFFLRRAVEFSAFISPYHA